MCHRLSPTYGDNVLCPKRSALVVGNMDGNEIDIAELIVREICNW